MIPSHPSVNDQGSKVPKPLYNIKEEDFSKLEPTSLLKPSIDTNASLLAPLKANKTYQAYTSKSNQENVITGLNGINGIKNHQNIHHLNNNNNINKNINKVKTLVEIKQEDVSKVDQQTQQINQQQSQPPSLLTQTIENNTTLLTPLKAPKSYGTYSKQQQEDVIAFIKDGNSLRTAEKVFGIPKSTMHCWLKKIHNNAEALNNQNNNNNNNNNSHNNNNNNNNSNNNNSNNNNSINSIHHNSNNHQHHISNNSSNNSSPVEHFSDLNIDTHFPYSTVNNNNNNSSHNNNNNNNNTTNNNSSLNGSCPDYYSGTKVKQLKNNHHNHQRKPNPSSQIVIEESELIRFLQSNEGMEMIAKAYCVTVHDFLEFIQHTKAKTQEGLKGLLVSTSQTRPVEVIGFIPNRKSSLDTKDSTTRDNQPISPNTARKRNLQVDVNGEKVVPPVAVLQKKIKVEHNAFDTKDDTTTTNIINNNTRNSNITNAIINNNSNNSSLLASLLTKGSYKNEPDWKPVMPTKVVLTTKQYLAASKIINAAQPNLVNTFLSPKPLAISADGTTNRVQPVTQTANTVLMCSDQSDINNNCNSSTETLFDPTTDLALAYPKITNPVSIKAERLDSEITLPCDVSPNSTSIDCIRTFTPVVHSITRPTVTSNNTATLNLNEINRTQSERELMAMVGGDNVSADELCAEFKETLELSNWVDNETWYMDQYLQHFQVSPAITSPGSSLPDAEIEDLDEGDNNGLTFAVDKDKEKIRKSSRSSLDMDKMENIVPVTVNIFEPYKSSGEVWTTLSSPPGLLNSPRLNDNLLNSPNLNDELLSSPRMNDGLLCSPVISEGLCSPRLHDRGLLGSPHKEQLLTHLHETGLDPNLIQPNFNSFTNQNSTTSTNEPIDEKPTVLRGTKFHSAFYRPNKTFERTTSSAFTKSVK